MTLFSLVEKQTHADLFQFTELPTGMLVGLKYQASYALSSLPHVMSASCLVLGLVVVDCYLTSMWYIGLVDV